MDGAPADGRRGRRAAIASRISELPSGCIHGSVVIPSPFHDFMMTRGQKAPNSTKRQSGSGSGLGPWKPPTWWPRVNIPVGGKFRPCAGLKRSVFQAVAMPPDEVRP